MLFLFISGDKFDIKDYHHVFLSAGPMGLDTLEEAVDEYIENTLNKWTHERDTGSVRESRLASWSRDYHLIPLLIINTPGNHISPWFSIQLSFNSIQLSLSLSPSLSLSLSFSLSLSLSLSPVICESLRSTFTFMIVSWTPKLLQTPGISIDTFDLNFTFKDPLDYYSSLLCVVTKRIFCIPKVFEDEIPLWQEIPSLPLAIIQLSQNYTSV